MNPLAMVAPLALIVDDCPPAPKTSALAYPRVLIAPDKFKGTLSAEAAAAAIDRGLRRAWPGVQDFHLGTGLLIAEALGAGYREILVGLGGSATTEGGISLASVIGFSISSGRIFRWMAEV